MKVIDLLNKIANGEEVRFRIIEESGIYHWNKDEYMVFEYTGDEEQWYIDDNWLNKEVEIIEEDKKIETIDPIDYCHSTDTSKDMVLVEKINEIIDKINKEK